MLTYNVQLRKEEEGGYTAIVPALPGCITYGETVDEAIVMVKEAVELYIDELIDRGEPIPDDRHTLELSIHVEAV